MLRTSNELALPRGTANSHLIWGHEIRGYNIHLTPGHAVQSTMRALGAHSTGRSETQLEPLCETVFGHEKATCI